MKTFQNISLRSYNSFNLNISSKRLVTIESSDEAIKFFNDFNANKEPFLLLGNGSNMLFINDYPGTIIRSQISYITAERSDNDHIIITAGSGVLWDELVNFCVCKGYGGIENLSLIPGTGGAAAVQNIGAYGSEAKDTIERVFAVSTTDGSSTVFDNAACRFGYRESVFKSEYKGKYFITGVSFRLSTKPVYNVGYGSLASEVETRGGPGLANIRNAVITIRQSKLPDPAVLGNAGSFFKNPIINSTLAGRLKEEFSQVPLFYDSTGAIKVAAGWLIEQCGWKGYRTGDAGVHPHQALILVNYGSATGSEILRLSEKIHRSVLERFNINLEREAEVINVI